MVPLAGHRDRPRDWALSRTQGPGQSVEDKLTCVAHMEGHGVNALASYNTPCPLVRLAGTMSAYGTVIEVLEVGRNGT